MQVVYVRTAREDDTCADNNVVYEYHQWFRDNLETEIQKKISNNVSLFIGVDGIFYLVVF